MAINWTAPGLAAGCGLATVLLVTLIRGFRFKNWKPHLSSATVAFLGGTMLPLGITLVFYPFFDTPPDLKAVVAYVPIAGLAFLWGAYATISQALKDGTHE